jgi:glycosyltransferase involved in cell wall biosynthesis
MTDLGKAAFAHKPLVIVIGCDTFSPDINGAARFAERLAGGLVRRGHEVHVIAPSTNKRYGTYREMHDGVAVIVHRVKSYRIPGHQSLRFATPIGLRSSLQNLLSKTRPDAVHIQSHLLLGRILAKETNRKNIRLVATNHTMPENLIRYFWLIPKFLESLAMRFAWWDADRILRRAELVTSPTKKAADILMSKTNIRDVVPISCGINAQEFAGLRAVSAVEKRALYVGRLDYEKRVHVLIEAVSFLPEALGVTLEIVGDGSERRSLETWAAELGIDERVFFKGNITDAELPKAFERATVFVMPSTAELQSIATLEAMASGRPIIAANAAALPHLVHEGENGFLFTPDSAQDLAAKMQLVFNADDSGLRRLGDGSLFLIQSHDIQQTVSRFELIYQGLASQVTPTEDNLGTYTQAIQLSPQATTAFAASRESAARLLKAAEKASSGVLERLDDVSGEVAERFTEIGFDVLQRSKRASKQIERSIRKALARFRGRDK